MGSLDIVDRARADHYEQTVVGAIKNVANDFAALGDSAQGSIAQRDITLELIGSDQGLVRGDV
ncbi:hypothetical protein D3C86_892970 [compost metagenome]